MVKGDGGKGGEERGGGVGEVDAHTQNKPVRIR